MNNLLKRFLRYVAIDTQSAESAGETGAAAPFPSTTGQLTLLTMLANEMREMGLTEVTQDLHGYVFGTIPANAGGNAPCAGVPGDKPGDQSTIGFLAHVDTSPDVSGANVCPQVVRDYDGGDIALGTSELTLSPLEFPALKALRGHTLVTTDGTTLLGADDKAGVAAIMTAAERLMAANAPAHGRIRIGFTPDEEVGRGTDFFDVEAFDAAYAYTVDGGAEGELEWENFNAATARVEFRGHNIHPGEAFGRMASAVRMAAEFDTMLGDDERPETTRDRDGFYHLVRLEGGVESAEAKYLLRDFDRRGLERRKQRLSEIAGLLNAKYGTPANNSAAECDFSEREIEAMCDIFDSNITSGCDFSGNITEPDSPFLNNVARADLPGGVSPMVSVTVHDSYYNMADILHKHPEVVERVRCAMLKVGVQPIVRPIRGGTDGARLSFMGLPCPNLFTGGANFHSRHEYCSLTSMQKAVEVIIELSTASS